MAIDTASWYVAVITGHQVPSPADVSERFGGALLAALGADALTESLYRLSGLAEIADGPVVDATGFRVVLSIKGGPARWEIRCGVGVDGRIVSLSEGKPISSDLKTVVTNEITGQISAQIHAVFDRTYRDADHNRLDASIDSLGTVALGYRADQLVGFALGGSAVADLPERTLVLLAGLCCVAPEHRRQGIAGRLENLALSRPTSSERAPRVLSAGRMAHPGSYRQMGVRPDAVPRPGVRPSTRQREVGSMVASLYGAADFDDEHFVCIGDGRGVGTPLVDVSARPEELELFRHVDRARGDTLLALSWVSRPPAEW